MKLSGWGRYPVVDAHGRFFESRADAGRLSAELPERIVHALGRSYGDAALGGKVLFSRRFDKLLDFDSDSGRLVCESGVSLGDLIEIFLPRGWFLLVTPGTRFVTVGGAVAADVHGKNHHAEGCFSECVSSLELLLPNGETVRCSRTENAELFHATCGGMGLTGIILAVEMRLRRVSGAFIDLFEEHRHAPYSVAWIDCLGGGKSPGRSVLMLGEHASTGTLALHTGMRLSVPFDFPSFCMNRLSVSLFNAVYYRAASPARDRLVHLESFFYPLDSVLHWNRMYGRRGFTQYQFVLPREAGREGLREILARIARSGRGSFLAVLKLLGKANDNLLSFPMEGWTLALDFKIDRGLFPFLDELDRIVVECGGRIYLAKDARMSRETFRAGYPRLEEFQTLRLRYGMNGKFESLQSRRLGV